MCGFGHWAGLSWNSAASLHHATFLIHGTHASQSYKYSHYLTFSSSKCKYMIISRKKNPSHPPALKLGSSALDRVYSYRYLGLLLTLSLCWTEHINDMCAKAKRMVGLLYRRFYKDASPQTLFQIYLALVRPHTEYASQVWDPHLQKDIDQAPFHTHTHHDLNVISILWSRQYVGTQWVWLTATHQRLQAIPYYT